MATQSSIFMALAGLPLAPCSLGAKAGPQGDHEGWEQSNLMGTQLMSRPGEREATFRSQGDHSLRPSLWELLHYSIYSYQVTITTKHMWDQSPPYHSVESLRSMEIFQEKRTASAGLAPNIVWYRNNFLANPCVHKISSSIYHVMSFFCLSNTVNELYWHGNK